MSREIIAKRKIKVAGITEEINILRPKNKNDYHAQQPPHKNHIEMTENFFISGYFTKKEADAIFLHEAYHKRSRLNMILDYFDYLFFLLAGVFFWFFHNQTLVYIPFEIIFFVFLYFAINTPMNRKDERCADEFSARYIGKQNLISALEKLYAINKHNVFYRFFYDLFHYPKEKRLRHISNL